MCITKCMQEIGEAEKAAEDLAICYIPTVNFSTLLISRTSTPKAAKCKSACFQFCTTV